MAKIDYKTIEEYHSAYPAELQERMQFIRDVIRIAVSLGSAEDIVGNVEQELGCRFYSILKIFQSVV